MDKLKANYCNYCLECNSDTVEALKLLRDDIEKKYNNYIVPNHYYKRNTTDYDCGIADFKNLTLQLIDDMIGEDDE